LPRSLSSTLMFEGVGFVVLMIRPAYTLRRPVFRIAASLAATWRGIL
jgi:hypothetical protein